MTEAEMIVHAQVFLKERWDAWPEAWKSVIPFQSLVECVSVKAKPDALCNTTVEDIRRQLGWMLTIQVEFQIDMQLTVIPCREGRHPSCIHGQPYDPRYQNPDTSPKKESRQ